MKKIFLLLIGLSLVSCTNKQFATQLDPKSEDRVVSINQPITYQIDGFTVVDEIDPRYKFIFESRIAAPKSTESVFNGIVQATGVSFLGTDKMVITYNTKDNTIEGGFDIVNIADLKHPVILKSYLLPEMEFADSRIVGNKLYLSGVDQNNGAVLVTVDLSNINSPQLVDKKVLSSYYGTSLSLKNTNLLVTSGDLNGHVSSYNLDSNGVPQLQYKDEYQNLLYVQHYADGYVVLYDEGGKTYLGYKNKSNNNLSKINLRNVHFESPARFDISGNVAFVATADEQVIEIVDLSTMTKLKTITTSGRGNGLKFDNGLLYTAQGLEGFKLFDVRDLNNIVNLGRFDFNDDGAGNNVWTYTLGSKRVVVVADGLGGVKILSQDLNELPSVKSCLYADNVVSYSPVGTIEADRKNPAKALGSPQGDSVTSSIEFVSLGKGGSIVLSFNTPLKNISGKKDLRVFETTWDNNTYAQYPEQADVYGSNDGTTWTYLGLVKNDNGDPSLGEVDLGSLTEAKYIKIVDKTTWAGSPDGFDVDAIQCLNQPSENIAEISGKDFGVLWKDGASSKIYRVYVDESNKKVNVYSIINSKFNDSHIGIKNDGRELIEFSGNNTKMVTHDLATKLEVSTETLSENRITQVAIDPVGNIIVGNPDDNKLYIKNGSGFTSLGNIYVGSSILDIQGGDIAFYGNDLFLGTQFNGGQIYKVTKDSSGKLIGELLYSDIGLISGLAIYKDLSDNKVKFLSSILNSQEMVLTYDAVKIKLKLQGEILSQSSSGDLAIRNSEGTTSIFSVCSPNAKVSCPITNGIGEKTCNSCGTEYSECTLKSCNSGYVNISGQCVAQVCSPNTTTSCVNNHLVGTKSCNAQGTAYGSCVTGSTCESGYYYENGSCLPQVCSPNSNTSCSISNGIGQKTCNAQGSGYGSCTLTSCNSGFYQSGSQCIAQVCSPNTTASCVNNHLVGVKTCNSQGSSYSSCVTGSTCESGYYYSNGSCLPQVCSPNSNTSCPITNGSGSKTCDSLGSGYGSCVLTSCNSGYTNVNGQCVAQICSPNTTTSCINNHLVGVKTCNAQGTEYGSCLTGSTCEPGYTYVNGSCVAQVCSPSSTKTCQVNNGVGQSTCSQDGLSWSYCVNLTCNQGFLPTYQLGSEILDNGSFNAKSSIVGLKNNKVLSNLLGESQGNWDVYSSLPKSNDPSQKSWTLLSGAGIEVWPDGNGGGLLEMDSDPTNLSQSTNYSIGQQVSLDGSFYMLSIDYKPRSSTQDDNKVGLYLGTNSLLTLNQTSTTQSNWKTYNKIFSIAGVNQFKISGEGLESSYGGLIDNVSIKKILSNGQCLSNVCTPNTTTSCINNHLIGTKTCSSDGSSYGSCVTGSTCESGYYYENGVCQPQICSPNSNASCSVLNGVGQKTCNSQGSAYGSCLLSSCNSGFINIGGQCVAQVCSPNTTTSCVNNHLVGTKSCNAQGTAYGSCVTGSTCESGYYYENGSCLPQVCSPNQYADCSAQNGSGLKQCNSQGSSWGSCLIQTCNSGFNKVLVPSEHWTFCSNEYENCNFSGTQTVRYGKNGVFTSKVLSNGTACSNLIFGDPLYGVVKECDLKGHFECKPKQICVPHSKYSCDDDSCSKGYKTCNSEGSGYSSCVHQECKKGHKMKNGKCTKEEKDDDDHHHKKKKNKKKH